MSKANKAIDSSDEFGVLSAIWILACNDENPIITFEGLRRRLELPDDYDVSLLVKSHRELFRLGVPEYRLNNWKSYMRQGNKIPQWIKDINNSDKQQERIESLSVNDVFRSQFRVEKDADKSSLEILRWGLEHLDRIRKARLEASDERFKWRAGLVLPIGALILNALLIGSGAYWQWQSTKLQEQNIKNQESLKKYEVSFKPKQESYVAFIKSFEAVYENVSKGNKEALFKNLEQLNEAFYSLQPFLKKESREPFQLRYKNFIRKLEQVSSEDLPDTVKNIDEERAYFRDELLKMWFDQ